MRNPTTYKFLVWAGPTSVLFVGGCLALIATFAQTYDGVKHWAQKLFDQCWPVVSAPWFLIVACVAICAYIAALVWTGRGQGSASGVWLAGHGLGHRKVSAETAGPIERPFFSLPRRVGVVDQLIAAKERSNEAAIDRRLSVERWVPLHEALRYLVYESEWAQQQAIPNSKADFDRTISMEMLEMLARGELHARGVKGGAFSNPDRPTEEIPLHYWTHAFIQPHGEIVMADSNRAAAGNPTGSDTYRRIILSSDDLVSIWPRGQIETPSPLASFVEPAREQYEKSKAVAGQ